jgi:hypothetical protein
MFKTVLRFAAWALLCLIAFFTLCPIEDRPHLTDDAQIERAVAYFIVGALLAAAYPRSRLLAGLGLVLAASSLELSQEFVPGRDAGLPDLMAKAGGGIGGVGAFWAVSSLAAAAAPRLRDGLRAVRPRGRSSRPSQASPAAGSRASVSRSYAIGILRRIPALHSLSWRTRVAYHRARRSILIRRRVGSADGLLAAAIAGARPYAAGKMGSTECASAATHIKRLRDKRAGRTARTYPRYLMDTLFVNSGVFPQDAATYDRFFEIYLDAVSRCDALASWDVAGEVEILRLFAPAAALVTLGTLDPFYSATRWTAALAGKRVLVVSPFAETIKRQFCKRRLLWDNPDILPDFDLSTLRAPLSAGLGRAEDSSWVEALARLKSEMDGLEYDVALIGAGAFSLPLAVHAKTRGRVGIHLGGSTQLLFGIYGNRWVKQDFFKSAINSNWTRPSPDETPQDAKRNEDGAYW